MKQKFGKSFILIPIGLCWNSVILLMAVSHSKALPDFVVGGLMGIGIAIMLLPFIIIAGQKRTKCQVEK